MDDSDIKKPWIYPGLFNNIIFFIILSRSIQPSIAGLIVYGFIKVGNFVRTFILEHDTPYFCIAEL